MNKKSFKNALRDLIVIFFGVVMIFVGWLGLSAENNPVSFEEGLSMSAKDNLSNPYVVEKVTYISELQWEVQNKAKGFIPMGTDYYFYVGLENYDKLVIVGSRDENWGQDLCDEEGNVIEDFEITGDILSLDTELRDDIKASYSEEDLEYLSFKYYIRENSEKENRKFFGVGIAVLLMGIVALVIRQMGKRAETEEKAQKIDNAVWAIDAVAIIASIIIIIFV